MVEHLPTAEGRSRTDREGIEQHILLNSYDVMMAHYVIYPG
jgi:hypothetical protein